MQQWYLITIDKCVGRYIFYEYLSRNDRHGDDHGEATMIDMVNVMMKKTMIFMVTIMEKKKP